MTVLVYIWLFQKCIHSGGNLVFGIGKPHPTFTYSKSTIETLQKGMKYVERHQWYRFGVFVANFEYR